MIYKRDSISRIIDQIILSRIVIFSTYVWNINISLEIAKQIKEKIRMFL